MKTITTIACIAMLLSGLALDSFGTSPVPEEVKPGQSVTICNIHLACNMDQGRGMTEETNSRFAFEASVPKKDVLEWVTTYVNNKLTERNVSEFRVDCTFPQQ